MYAGEKSDEAIVLRKRPNKGGQLPSGGRGGKGLTQGKQPTGCRGSDAEPSCHVDPVGGCAAARGGHKLPNARLLIVMEPDQHGGPSSLSSMRSRASPLNFSLFESLAKSMKRWADFSSHQKIFTFLGY
jgi:hypothetical protein